MLSETSLFILQVVELMFFFVITYLLKSAILSGTKSQSESAAYIVNML